MVSFNKMSLYFFSRSSMSFNPSVACQFIHIYTSQVSLEENSSTMQCVSHETFYQRLDDFKQKQKRNTSQITMFIENQIYNEAT